MNAPPYPRLPLQDGQRPAATRLQTQNTNSAKGLQQPTPSCSFGRERGADAILRFEEGRGPSLGNEMGRHLDAGASVPLPRSARASQRKAKAQPCRGGLNPCCWPQRASALNALAQSVELLLGRVRIDQVDPARGPRHWPLAERQALGPVAAASRGRSTNAARPANARCGTSFERSFADLSPLPPGDGWGEGLRDP